MQNDRYVYSSHLTNDIVLYIGAVAITHFILIGSLVFGLLSLLTAILASFHKKHVLVTATVALECASGRQFISIIVT